MYMCRFLCCWAGRQRVSYLGEEQPTHTRPTHLPIHRHFQETQRMQRVTEPSFCGTWYQYTGAKGVPCECIETMCMSIQPANICIRLCHNLLCHKSSTALDTNREMEAPGTKVLGVI